MRWRYPNLPAVRNANSVPSAGKGMPTVSELSRYTLLFHLKSWWNCECDIALCSSVSTWGVCCKRLRILKNEPCFVRSVQLRRQFGNSNRNFLITRPTAQTLQHLIFTCLVHRKNTVLSYFSGNAQVEYEI